MLLRNTIRIRLIGGLGNQLFGYFAAKAIAQASGRLFQLDTSWTEFGMTNHGTEIRKLALAGEWLPDTRSGTRVLPPGTLRGRIGQRTARMMTNLGLPLGYCYWSEGDGFADVSEGQTSFLRGYFQHASFVDQIAPMGELEAFHLRRSDPWLIEKIAEAAQICPVSVHVRLGDYTSNGVSEALGSKYYLDALELLREEFPDNPVWIFTDDSKLAKRMLVSDEGRRFNFIESPAGVSAASELVLMNHMHAHVISNSTFSWWGARASRSSRVIYPRPWFRRGTPNGLIPEDWIPVLSR